MCVGQVVDDVALDELGAGQVPPALHGALALHRRDVHAGGGDALGGQRGHRVAAAEPQLQRRGRLPQQLVAGAVPLMLTPAEGVLERLLGRLGLSLAGAVAVPVSGGAGGLGGAKGVAHRRGSLGTEAGPRSGYSPTPHDHRPTHRSGAALGRCGPRGLWGQWQLEPGWQGVHLAPSRCHNGQSTAKPLFSMTWAVLRTDPSYLNSISGVCSRNLPLKCSAQKSR
ncbi:hypothetical protein NORO109296_26340 [Nocardiopsis rhodophaea]